MAVHGHEPVALPGGPVDAEGNVVDEALLAALTGAARHGCARCSEPLLDDVAAQPACVARLVEVTRMVAIRANHGDLPAFMTDADISTIPTTREFTHLVRAATAAEPLTAVCARMTTAERRAAARTAADILAMQLAIVDADGLDTTPTLAEQSCTFAVLLLRWWYAYAPLAREELTRTWQQHTAAHPDALLLDGPEALALLLGAVLHHQARLDHVTAEDMGQLVFTRVLPVLEDPERTAAVLAAFVGPPQYDATTVPVKRHTRADPQFLADLCGHLRSALTRHAAECPHGLRETGHACTIEHRAPVLARTTTAAVAEPAPHEGRRVALPRLGFREDAPTEGEPAGQVPGHVWQINVEQIVVERWDADAARFNKVVSEDSTISTPNYRNETGLEPVCCPACGSVGPFLAEGAWGDPLTLHCRCGVTVMSPLDAAEDDFGRNLLKRLILCEADPAYAARRVMPALAEHQERARRMSDNAYYWGPDDEDVALADAVAWHGGDLVTALTEALQPRLPQRHEGRALALLLLQAHQALSAPAVRTSPDGRRLEESVRDLLADLKQECDRWAPTRAPVTDLLHSWQTEGGPQLWQDAWTRTLQVAERHHLSRSRVGNGRVADGCAALTLAQYLLASEAGSSVDQVTTEDVRALAQTGEADGQDTAAQPVLHRWAERLRALGHDLDAADDPVARLWRHLASERPGRFGEPAAPALTIGLDDLIGHFALWPIRL